MSDDGGRDRRPPSTDTRRGGYDIEQVSHRRSDRRARRRVVRRRKKIARLALVAGPAVLVILVVALLLVFLGGPERSGEASPTSTATSTSRTSDSAAGPSGEGSTSTAPGPDSTITGEEIAAVFIKQEGSVPAVVLLIPQGEAGLALGMPGNTILKTDGGFKTLEELEAAGGDGEKAFEEALERDFGIRPVVVAWAKWGDVLAALAETGQAGSLPLELETGKDGAAAAAAAALMGAASSAQGSSAWQQIEVHGDQKGLRSLVGYWSQSVSAGGWAEKVLPGKMVEGVATGGEEFGYFEPDPAGVRALLAGDGADLDITVQVENGSGLVGAAEQAGSLLEPLGYELLPFKNAADFPDVKATQIISGPDTGGAAELVRRTLGVGKVRDDPSLDKGRVVVIVGKDFIPDGR